MGSDSADGFKISFRVVRIALKLDSDDSFLALHLLRIKSIKIKKYLNYELKACIL